MSLEPQADHGSSQTTELIDSPANSQQLLQAQDSSKGPWETLFAQLEEQPHDPDGWKRLLDLVEGPGVSDLGKIKSTYEALLTNYPNTVCFANMPVMRR
jgi:cleavage stimulation factor subunit 3